LLDARGSAPAGAAALIHRNRPAKARPGDDKRPALP